PARHAGCPPSEQRDQVLDVSCLQVTEPAVLDERNLAPSQLQLQLCTVVRGPHENRLLAQLHAFLTPAQDPVADLDRLCRLVATEHELWASAALFLRAQLLWKRTCCLSRQGVCDIEGWLHRAIVALERDHSGVGEMDREVQDVVHRRSPPAIDCL